MTALLCKRGMDEIGRGQRFTEKVRFRWTQKPSEINWKHFIEGRNIANHLPNSSVLTDKFKFFHTMDGLEESM